LFSRLSTRIISASPAGSRPAGLVQQHHGGPHRQHAGDRDPLLFAEADVVDCPFQVQRRDQRQRLRHALDLRVVQAEVARPEGHVFLDRRREELIGRVLQHHADLAADLARLHCRDVPLPKPYGALPGLEQPDQDLEQRGLARAIGGQQRDKLPAVETEFDPVERQSPVG
jgi:hypothetical protein